MSCHHQMRTSVHFEVQRLKKEGFAQDTVALVVEALMKEVSSGRRKEKTYLATRPVVIPYIHNVSHRLEKVANKCAMAIVFSVPNELAQMCRDVKEEFQEPLCKKKHAFRVMNGTRRVVYQIPLSCKKYYVAGV